jgi:hypothetical protein
MHKGTAAFLDRRNAKFLGIVPSLAAALFAAWGGLASAAGTRAGGTVHAYEADAGKAGAIILTGAITDHGTDQSVPGHPNYGKLVLSKGSFEINPSRIGNIPLDPNTCVSAGSASGQVPIVKGTGTGAYRGIRGTFQTTVTSAAILPRLKNHTCDTSATHGYPSVFMARASGDVSYK